jgi:hypothetical protein
MFRRLAVLSCAAVLAAVLLAPAAPARPLRGHVPWSVLLCRFSDVPAQPQPPSFFQAFLTDAGANQGGVAAYYRAISGGAIDLAGSTVQGWFTENVTLAQSQVQTKSRHSRIDDCVAAARAGGVTVPVGNRVIAITNGVADSGSEGGRVLLDPLAWNDAFAAHEMGHAMGLGAHTFSNDPTFRGVGWSQIGEYDDPWDLMSAMNVFTIAGPFAPDPPGLTAEYLDREGWLGRNEILTFGADGARSRRVTLTNLYAPGASGIREVRVPFDPGDLYHYFTVELRARTAWDGGIPASTVLIHEVRRTGGGQPIATLQRAPTPARAGAGLPANPTNAGTFSANPAQQVNANGVTITVNAVEGAGNHAFVTISSPMADRCRAGFVWREARPSDHVCVTTQVRADAVADNRADRIRHVPRSRTCLPGFVWREAFSGDFVCVVPSRRTQARNDNAAAGNRNNPARDVFGPNTCRPGYVWREADQRDWVCVGPRIRDDVRADNAAAPGRHDAGTVTCHSGFVWREAFPGDLVCVVPSRRTQARNDNAAAGARLAVP